MSVKIITLVLVAALLNLSGATLITTRAGVALPQAAPVGPDGSYGQLPLSFERNQGQTAREVEYLTRGAGYTLFLTPREAVLKLQTAVLRTRFEGGNPAPRLSGLEKVAGASNYLTLDDSRKPVTEVAHYARVSYAEVYPGIDLVYYGNQRQLEYDFIVAPGADPSVIKLSYEGADRLDIEADGALSIQTGEEKLRVSAPFIYQEQDGERTRVDGRFRLDAQNRVSFELGAYDRTRELVIDPTLLYATYLGGGDDEEALGIAVDAAGNTYITGYTYSTNFPTITGSLQVSDIDPTTVDAFITKLNPAGTALVYSTYVGGVGDQAGNGIAVDAAGRATVVGSSTASDADGDAFVIRLNAAGSSASTAGGYVKVFGGLYDNTAEDVALDAAGNAYITGETASVGGSNFPVVNAIQPAFSGGLYDTFLTKLDTAGNITYSTYLHITQAGDYDEFGRGVAVDPAGNMYVAGFLQSYCSPPCDNVTSFLFRLNAAGNSFAYGVLLGGNGFDQITDLAVDSAGNAYVTGTTNSTNFPTVGPPLQAAPGGGLDAFVTRVSPAGTATYSTYLGTATNQEGHAIALDTAGNIYLAGDNRQNDADGDVFVMKLGKNGSTYLLSSGYTYTFGGTLEDYANDLAVDAAGNAYVAGITSSTDFPDTPGAFQGTKGAFSDAFVTKVGDAVVPPANNPVADFDGDGKSDVAVWRASNGGWYVVQSGNNQVRSNAFGASGDKITPGDYDGDGRADLAVFRPANGYWYIIRSSNNAFSAQQFGVSTDVPVAGDYDGDGKTDIAVWRASNGTFYILQSTNGALRVTPFGQNGDKPVVGDYDGDGKADAAVWRPSNGTWYLLRSQAGFVGQPFGTSTDLPAQGDFDGDGKTDLAVFRPANGTWYLQRSQAGFTAQQFGANGDKPAPGDFDGDNKTDIAIFRPSNGGWYIQQSTAGFRGLTFGTNGDVPVEAGYLP